MAAAIQHERATELHCAWCGADLRQGARRLEGRTRCSACGAATTDPWPDEAELEAAYAGWYRPAPGRFSGLGESVLRRSRGRLAWRLDAIAPPGPVLDVGAGDGTLLDALRSVGREAIGLERISDRPDVQEREVEDLVGPFAAVVMWHSLEHLRRPRAALESAAAMLAPGGVLVIAIPNADSLQARAFGDRWFALDLPRHLVHVGERALASRLRELGMHVERTSQWRGGQVVFGWLHGLVDAATRGASLYDAIRRPEARSAPMGAERRAAVLAIGALLLPVAVVAAGIEIAARRGGTAYLEARRA